MKQVSPEEAFGMMEKEGYVYVDVRSVAEFGAGHPADAFNVPLLDMTPRGMAPNPDFMSVMAKGFAKDAKLIVGCKSGGRSLHAVQLLEAAGYQDVVLQRCGYDGAPDPLGRFEPGWKPKGLPTSQEAAPERTYAGLKGQ